MMKALVWYEKKAVRIEERPIPSIANDEVLMKVSFAGICGSDIHIIDGEFPENIAKPPLILGHEFSGIITEVGKDVTEYKEGDRATAHPFVGCGGCYFCKRAQEHFCTNPYCVLWDPRSGAFAEYVVLKARQVYKIPDTMSLEEAALVEPISIAVHALDLVDLKIGHTVAIQGAGAIGLACLQIALRSGASLAILSDPVESRLKIGQKLGADVVVNPIKENLYEIVKEKTNGLGVDLSIDAATVKNSLDACIPITKNTGTVLIVGVAPHKMRMEVSPFEIYSRELRIQGSNWSPYSFIRTIPIMDKINVEPMITHVFPLTDYIEAIGVARGKEGIKVLLTP